MTLRGTLTTLYNPCTGAKNNCSQSISLPLWDVEHSVFTAENGVYHCGDGAAGLSRGLPSAPPRGLESTLLLRRTAHGRKRTCGRSRRYRY